MYRTSQENSVEGGANIANSVGGGWGDVQRGLGTLLRLGGDYLAKRGALWGEDIYKVEEVVWGIRIPEPSSKKTSDPSTAIKVLQRDLLPADTSAK